MGEARVLQTVQNASALCSKYSPQPGLWIVGWRVHLRHMSLFWLKARLSHSLLGARGSSVDSPPRHGTPHHPSHSPHSGFGGDRLPARNRGPSQYRISRLDMVKTAWGLVFSVSCLRVSTFSSTLPSKTSFPSRTTGQRTPLSRDPIMTLGRHLQPQADRRTPDMA